MKISGEDDENIALHLLTTCTSILNVCMQPNAHFLVHYMLQAEKDGISAVGASTYAGAPSTAGAVGGKTEGITEPEPATKG